MYYIRKIPTYKAIQVSNIKDFAFIQPLPDGYIAPKNVIGSMICKRSELAIEKPTRHLVYENDWIVFDSGDYILYRDADFRKIYEPAKEDDHAKKENTR